MHHTTLIDYYLYTKRISLLSSHSNMSPHNCVESTHNDSVFAREGKFPHDALQHFSVNGVECLRQIYKCEAQVTVLFASLLF